MHRREFLLRSSVLALLPLGLSGCVIPAGGRRESPVGGSWLENSQQAQSLFRSVETGSALDAQGVPYAVSTQRNAWLASRRHFSSINSPSFSDAYALASASAEYFSAANMQAVPQKKNRSSYRDGNGIMVMPGEMVSWNETGFCMDPSLPAPGRGELLRLVPTESLVVDELRPVYEGVLRQAARNDNVGLQYRRSMQQLVWMFRTAGQDSPYLSHPSAQVRQLIDAAHPNGWEVLNGYHRRSLANNRFKADIANVISRAFNLPGNARPADFSDQGKADRIVDQQMQTLLNTPVGGQVVPGSQYSLLAPGVAAEVVGTGPLAAQFRVVNQSGEPFRFSPTEWSAESQRKSQRVAFSGNVQSLARNSLPSADPTAWRDRFFDLAPTDYGKVGVEKFLQFAPTSIGQLVAKQSAVRAFKGVVDIVPVLGNTLALYEAVSGKNWLTQEPLDSLDLALAVVGTVPGASTLARLGGGARGAVKAVLDGAAASRAASVVDRTRIAQDVINLGNMESTKTLVSEGASDPMFQGVVQSARNLFKV